MKMSRIGFVGFGEINTPVDVVIITPKVSAARGDEELSS